MSNSDNPVGWFLGVGITFGLLGWVTFTLTDQLSSKLIKGVENQIENKSEVDVVVASNRLIQSQPEKISELLGVYYRHIDVSVRTPSQLQAQIAADGKLSATDAAAVLQGIEFFTSVEAQKWFVDGTLDKRIRSTAAVLTLTGKLNQVPQNPKDLYTSEFIAKATTNKQKLIDLVRADNLELTQKLESKTEKTFASTVDADKIKTAPGIGNLQVQGEIKFATNSSELTDEGKQTLNKLAERIAEFNEKTVAVRVIGHTSKFGDVNINQTISEQRVQAVANYLRSRGLKHKIVAVGEGSSRALPSVAAKDQRNLPTAIHLVRVN